MSETTDSHELAGYVPSAEAVEAGAEALAMNPWWHLTEETARAPHRARATVAAKAMVPVEVARLWSRIEALSSDLTEAESDRDRHDEDHRKACVTIAEMFEAGTGVSDFGPKAGVLEDLREVRRERDEVARLLGEVRALADNADEWPPGYDDAVVSADDLRAVLDTVGVPTQAPELFPGTRDQLGALGVRGVPERVGEAGWRDRQGDIWWEGADGMMHTGETATFPREYVERKWGPLKRVDEAATGGES